MKPSAAPSTALALGMLASLVAMASNGTGAVAQVVPDLVSRTALRVCADPANMPVSDRSQQGFENKIAEIVARSFGEPVRYLWAPSGPGFARNTLNSDFCDVVMGYTLGSDVMQPTNPYYRSTYVLVTKAGGPLADVQSLDDSKLKGHALGVFAATPPVDVMLKNGLLDKAKVYPLLVDHRFDSPLKTLVGDLSAGTIEAAIVWGPLIGLSVKETNGALVMAPLLKDASRPGFSYSIAFGIRHDEPDWKHKLEAVERSQAAAIDKVLVDYNVPLIDDAGHLIPPAQAATGAATLSASGGETRTTGASAKPSPSNFRMPGPAPTPQGFKMPGPPPSNATSPN